MGIVRDEVGEIVASLEQAASDAEQKLWGTLADEGITPENMNELNKLALVKLTSEAFAKEFRGLMERV